MLMCPPLLSLALGVVKLRYRYFWSGSACSTIFSGQPSRVGGRTSRTSSGPRYLNEERKKVIGVF